MKTGPQVIFNSSQPRKSRPKLYKRLTYNKAAPSSSSAQLGEEISKNTDKPKFIHLPKGPIPCKGSYFQKMLSQPAWVTEESPRQHEEVPALNIQSGEEEDKRESKLKRHLLLSEILEAFTLCFLKQDPGRNPILSCAGLSLGCAYR